MTLQEAIEAGAAHGAEWLEYNEGEHTFPYLIVEIAADFGRDAYGDDTEHADAYASAFLRAIGY